MEPSDKGIFLLVNVAALRARQLMQGATPLIRGGSRKPAAMAIREVQEGLIPYYLTVEEELTAEELLDGPEEELSEVSESEEAVPPA